MEKEIIEEVLNKHVHLSSDAINASPILDCNINLYCHNKGYTCETGTIIKLIYLHSDNGPRVVLYHKDTEDAECYIDISKIDFLICFSDEAVASQKIQAITKMLFGGK